MLKTNNFLLQKFNFGVSQKFARSGPTKDLMRLAEIYEIK